jgi:hypothetical protein
MVFQSAGQTSIPSFGTGLKYNLIGLPRLPTDHLEQEALSNGAIFGH